MLRRTLCLCASSFYDNSTTANIGLRLLVELLLKGFHADEAQQRKIKRQIALSAHFDTLICLGIETQMFHPIHTQTRHAITNGHYKKRNTHANNATIIPPITHLLPPVYPDHHFEKKPPGCDCSLQLCLRAAREPSFVFRFWLVRLSNNDDGP